ncbi:MAG: FAD-linked oxidase C-terminal domain-containing protein [Flavobacteriaceae bacterium]|jgi:glycolate oxidase|nr:FAD-linked oxidase C-terminal domain-containing protein [Flavobacteriaceae bacterium]
MLSDKEIQYFKSILNNRVHTDEENLLRCASDHTEDFVFKPQIVLQPKTTEEVSKILKYCNENKIIITPRGAGTGLSGGALPIFGSIVLDMKRMNKILKIDTKNFQITTEPAVITEELQNAVKELGLYYPVDPASKGSCFIGGNVAENSGGARAVKYGVVKDYVLNLEVVLPNGEIIWTGANTLKNSTGYNLTQLLVGSEGTLAVITKIVLKLLPYPQKDLLILVPFYSAHEACRAVNKIFLAGFNPSALEFMERDAILASQKFLDNYSLELPDDIQAHLLIEVNGNEEDVLMREIEGIVSVLEEFRTGEILFADTEKTKEELWKLRRVTGEAAKGNSIYKEEDTVVPRAKLPELLAKVKELGKEYGFDSICYGHAGDGNLHINIIKNNMSDEKWNNELPKAIRKLFVYTKELGGTISGEHGIGYVQKSYMDIAFSDIELDLMRKIKAVFDPNNILNPGKIFD